MSVPRFCGTRVHLTLQWTSADSASDSQLASATADRPPHEIAIMRDQSVAVALTVIEQLSTCLTWRCGRYQFAADSYMLLLKMLCCHLLPNSADGSVLPLGAHSAHDWKWAMFVNGFILPFPVCVASRLPKRLVSRPAASVFIGIILCQHEHHIFDMLL